MKSAQEYIKEQLAGISSTPTILQSIQKLPLEEQILRILFTRKFRTQSVTEGFEEHVKTAIKIQVEKNEPIQIVFLNGAYKLWRLKEAPEIDWAELFSVIHYTNWIKGICQIYKPGVHFDFFMDDLAAPKINTAPIEDVHTYIKSFSQMLTFMKKHQPENLNMTITPVGSCFKTEKAFDLSLEKNIEELTKNTPGGLVEIDEDLERMIELNAQPTKEQLEDPLWKRKVWHIHTAYSKTKGEPGYHRQEDKIVAFVSKIPDCIPVGTTKNSIMKFWIGAGVLEKKESTYIENILSPNQITNGSFITEDISINDLKGRNFGSIRIRT